MHCDGDYDRPYNNVIATIYAVNKLKVLFNIIIIVLLLLF